MCAFICFILVTVSAPFIRSLYVAHIQSAAKQELAQNLGVFGYCYPGGTTVLGFSLSDTACSKPTYPYQLDEKFFGYNSSTASNLNPLGNHFLDNQAISITKGIGKALILNPIAAALCLLGLIPSLISVCTTWRWTQIAAWFFLLLATICSWIAFIINIVFAALVKSRVKDTTKGNYVGSIGNATWVSLAGAILMSIAMALALFGSCCCIKTKKEKIAAEQHDMEGLNKESAAIGTTAGTTTGTSNAYNPNYDAEYTPAGYDTTVAAEPTAHKSKYAFWKK